jgi:hypothetical protein
MKLNQTMSILRQYISWIIATKAQKNEEKLELFVYYILKRLEIKKILLKNLV